jgi:formate-dependent nitrite reductase cytochrome c552 subunit
MTEITMNLVYCADCHMPFLIPATLVERLKKSHKDFFCPVGHANVFNAKSVEDNLREQIASQKKTIQKLTALKRKRVKK